MKKQHSKQQREPSALNPNDGLHKKLERDPAFKERLIQDLRRESLAKAKAKAKAAAKH